MKFIVGSGKELTEQIRDLTRRAPYYFDALRHSNIVILGLLENGTPIAGCGIEGLHHVSHSLYVREDYQGKGIGLKTFEETVNIGRKLGLDFITGVVPHYQHVAWHLYSKVGYKEIVSLKSYAHKRLRKYENIRIIILPYTHKGDLLYTITHSVCSKLPNILIATLIMVTADTLEWFRKTILWK